MKASAGVQPGEMLLICSESRPFYSYNYPQLSEEVNWRDLEHQKQTRTHKKRIIDLHAAENSNSLDLYGGFFHVRMAESNETVLLSQLLELDADAEAQRRFICA